MPFQPCVSDQHYFGDYTGGRVTHFVHSASPPRREADHAMAVSDDTWRQMHAVNLEAGFHLARELSRQLTAAKSPGSLLFLTSLHAGTPRNLPHYSTTKAGMAMLVTQLASAVHDIGTDICNRYTDWNRRSRLIRRNPIHRAPDRPFGRPIFIVQRRIRHTPVVPPNQLDRQPFTRAYNDKERACLMVRRFPEHCVIKRGHPYDMGDGMPCNQSNKRAGIPLLRLFRNDQTPAPQQRPKYSGDRPVKGEGKR